MARMVTLTIDGLAATVPAGTTILDAAEQVGIRIPTLCHDKRLIPFGSCRICVVQVKGKRGSLLPSCFNPVRDGMEVLTATPEVIESRKTQLQLMLLHHPLECPTCDQAGACSLQNLVYEYGVADNPLRQAGSQGKPRPVKEKLLIGSMAVKERDRCILCGSCVRICEEVQGVKEIDFIGRGFMTKIGTDFDRDLDCEFCGQCVSICPVGALTTALIKHQARHWELQKIQSVCAYCGCGCAVLLGVKENEVKTVISDYDTGANEGNLCVKGRYGWEYIHCKERLHTPLIRKDGKLVECTWGDALREVAARFKEIKESHGPDALAAIGSARLTNEEAYLLQKFMRAAIGTNNVDNSGRFSYEGLLAVKQSLGYAAMTNSIGEIRNADVIFVMRGDLRETHPLIKNEVVMALNRNKARLITANSYQTWLDEKAHAALVYRPGWEIALINGIIHVILEEHLEDRDFISSRTVGFEEVQRSVASYDPGTVEKLTGVSSKLIIAAARMYARGQRSVILIATGLSLRGNEAGLAQAAVNLALITGHLGRESTGINMVSEKNNSQGVLDMGLVPEYLPGYQDAGDTAARKKCALVWEAPLPATAGLTAPEMLKQAVKGKVKGLYLLGENPAATYPDRRQVLEALSSVDVLVVQDLFLSETAQLAHLVLPAVSFAEKEGTFTSIERRVQRLYRTIDPRGGAKSDFEIIQKLSREMGYDMKHGSPGEVMEEINSLVPLYAGISYERLNGRGLQWPCTSAQSPGSRFLYHDGFPSGGARLKPVESSLSEGEMSTEYPYLLVTVQSLCHSGSFSTRSRELCNLDRRKTAELNARDAQQLKIGAGDMIRITSRKGEITLAPAITDRTPPGRILVPYHHSELMVTVLTDWDNPLTRVSIKKV